MVFRPWVTTSIDDLGRAVELRVRFLERIARVVREGQL